MDIAAFSTALLAVIRVLGPVLAALGLALLLLQFLTPSGRARLRLASHGLSTARARWWRRLVAGSLVPVLGTAALTVSLALEQEVREGPNRMVDRLQDVAAPGELAWILQAGTHHFMNDSRLPPAFARRAVASGELVMWEQLVVIDDGSGAADTGLLIGLPTGAAALSPQVHAGADCVLREGRCELAAGEAVADVDLYPVGTRLRVRDQELVVVGNTVQPYSLINRAVVFTNNEAFRRPDETLEPPYAVLVTGAGARERADGLVRTSGSADVEVVDPSVLRSENARFWAGNGTPLLLVVIGLSTAFCGVALYAARRAQQEREQVVLGTLQAFGLRADQASLVDLLRALLATIVATAAAWPLATAVIALTNAGMLGFHAAVTPGMPVAAAGLLVLANCLGTVVLWWRLRRRSVTEALAA